MNRTAASLPGSSRRQAGWARVLGWGAGAGAVLIGGSWLGREMVSPALGDGSATPPLSVQRSIRTGGRQDRAPFHHPAPSLPLAVEPRWTELLQLAEQATATGGTTVALNAFLSRWLDLDSHGAAACARSLPGRLLGESVIRRVQAVLAQASAADAATFDLGLAGGALQNELLGQVLPQWAEKNWGSARAWADELPAGPGKQTALLHLLPRWEAEEAEDLLIFARELPPGFAQFQSVVATRQAARDPAGAALWAESLPEGFGRNQVVAAVVTVWAQQSPEAAAAYVAQLPPGAMQQAGLLAVVSVWTGRDREAALAWAASFADGTMREPILDRLAYYW